MPSTSPPQGTGDLETRARKAATRRRVQEARRVPVPERIQRTAANELGTILGVEVDPLTVRELEYKRPYDLVEVEVEGQTFRASMLWGGGDRGYSVAGLWKLRKRGLLRTRWIEFSSLADLHRWL